MHASAQTATHPAFWRSTFEQHSGVVLAFLVSRVGQREEAEDLLQETFVRAIRAGALRDAGKVRSYLLSIAQRLVIDRARRRSLVSWSQLDERVAAVADDSLASPAHEADLARLRDRLTAALAELSEPLRASFVAAVLEQRSYAEIAAARGWTRTRVRVNVHRARKRLIAALREQLQLDPGGHP